MWMFVCWNVEFASEKAKAYIGLYLHMSLSGDGIEIGCKHRKVFIYRYELYKLQKQKEKQDQSNKTETNETESKVTQQSHKHGKEKT